jgi:hypothetical protein
MLEYWGGLEYWNNGYWVFKCVIPVFHHSTIPIFQHSNFPFFCSDLRFVNVTPAPVLARFEGLDNGMAACVKVFSGMPIR